MNENSKQTYYGNGDGGKVAGSSHVTYTPDQGAKFDQFKVYHKNKSFHKTQSQFTSPYPKQKYNIQDTDYNWIN